jgi:hypothetical protein
VDPVTLPRKLTQLLGAVLLCCTPQSLSAAAPEAAVKATFLVKFLSYIEWPAGKFTSGSPVQICFVGLDPFGLVLDRATTGQQTRGRSIIVRRLSSAEGAASCHLAFLGGSGSAVQKALAAIGSRPVVTVSDARGSNRRAMIHFLVVDRRVRFAIDTRATARSGIEVSSQLLALAHNLRGGR